MIQQINLYQDSDYSSRHLLFNGYLLAFFTACAILIVLSALAWRNSSVQASDLQQLQQQLQQTTARVLMLQAQSPNQADDALLNQELQRSQTLYQSLSQVVELLADNQSDQTQGFSRYLTALADQSVGDVWLSRIKINTGTDLILLEGSSFKSEQIPWLLQRLQNTQAFKERHFARLKIQQSEANQEQVDFSVSSSLKPDDEEDHAH